MPGMSIQHAYARWAKIESPYTTTLAQITQPKCVTQYNVHHP